MVKTGATRLILIVKFDYFLDKKMRKRTQAYRHINVLSSFYENLLQYTRRPSSGYANKEVTTNLKPAITECSLQHDDMNIM